MNDMSPIGGSLPAGQAGASGGKKIIAILLFLLASGAIIFLVLYPKLNQTKNRPVVNNFEDCVRAGYPVMESYPRQCTAPGGKFFVESLIEEKKP